MIRSKEKGPKLKKFYATELYRSLESPFAIKILNLQGSEDIKAILDCSLFCLLWAFFVSTVKYFPLFISIRSGCKKCGVRVSREVRETNKYIVKYLHFPIQSNSMDANIKRAL